jgi:acyl-homoserine lactone acylase PvdQ
MIRYVEIVRIIEKNGLMLIAVAIVLFYWVFDVMTEGQMTNRILITLSIFAYGIFTQFLINAQKTAKESLQQAHVELERTNERLAHANEKLELAYAWMRDNRDELRQQMYEEDIGFLIDQDGRIEGVTDRALVVMKESRDALVGGNLIRLMRQNTQEDFSRVLKQAWKGITHHLTASMIMSEGAEREFDMKLTRVVVSGKRLLLVILS